MEHVGKNVPIYEVNRGPGDVLRRSMLEKMSRFTKLANYHKIVGKLFFVNLDSAYGFVL